MSRRVSSGHMVGRASELAVGQASLQAVLAGGSAQSAQVLLISGEAGIGKSRLLDELLAQAREAGAVTACGRCLDHGNEIRPLTAVVEILAELGPVAERADLVLAPGAAAAGGSVPAAAPPVSQVTTPAAALAGLFDQARSRFRALSARGPLVVAIEDLHWADRTTRELLVDLVRARGLERVLLIGTYRSDELHRRHPLVPLLADLEHAARPERIELGPLTEGELLELAGAILDGPIGEAPGRELARRSGGNPFYAEELLAVDDTERLPAGVRHVILARSQSLDPDTMTCLQAAATLSAPIDQTVLAATTELPPDRFRPAIDALCRERFLVHEEAGYRFRHELVREVFLDELFPGERSELFAGAAAALADHRPERIGEIALLHVNASQLPEALATSVRAAAAASAIGALAEASEHYGRAIDLWDRVDDPSGLAGISRLLLLRRAAEVADLTREFDVAVELARRAASEARSAGDRFEEGAAQFELSGYLWNASAPGMEDAIQRAMAVLPREPPTLERAMLESRAAMRRAFAGAREEADQALEAAAAMAVQVGARGVEIGARAHIGMWRAKRGDEEALRNMRHQLHQAYAIDDGPSGAVIAINLTHVLCSLGRYPEVVDLHDEGVAFTERHGLGATRGLVFESNVLEALEVLGRWDQAEAIMDDIQRRFSQETLHRWASAFLGWTQIQIHRGRLSDVVSSYRRGLEMWETGYYGGDQLPVGIGLVELAAAGLIDPIDPGAIESWLHGLQPDESQRAARLVATAARHLVPPAGSPDHGPILEIVRGWTDRVRRVATEYFNAPVVLQAWLDQAEVELAEAAGALAPDRWGRLASIWEEAGCRFYAAQARYRQADALLRAGGGRSSADRADAARLLAGARRTAIELAAGPLCSDIDDLIRRARLRLTDPGDAGGESDDASAPVEPSPFGLTDRELQVLRLVSEGRSNGEIGAALFISTKTASVHVSNILRKFGAANRIEAAAIGRRHRLIDV